LSLRDLVQPAHNEDSYGLLKIVSEVVVCRVHIVLITALAGLFLPATALGAAPAAVGNGWHIASYLSRLGTGNTAASCPSTTVCWAIEAGKLLSSGDGGATWTDETPLVPADAAELTDVSCPTGTQCYVTAILETSLPAVYMITSGSLGRAADTGAVNVLPTIDCPGTLRCFTTDGRKLFATSDGGVTWVAHRLAQMVDGPVALSCAPHTVACWIGGGPASAVVIERTLDSGRHWIVQAPPSGSGLVALSCPTTSMCYGSGNGVILTTDGGAHWDRAEIEGLPALWPLTSVSCATTTKCMAVGKSGLTTETRDNEPYGYQTTDGMQWTQLELTPIVQDQVVTQTSPGVSCATAPQCTIVADGTTSTTTDFGSTWDLVQTPTALQRTVALSCPRANACVGIENQDWAHAVAVTGSPDGQWISYPLPAVTGQLDDVDCPSARVCFATAAGEGGTEALRSRTGGRSWTVKSMVTDPDVPAQKLSCPDVNTCLTSHRDFHHRGLHVTTDGGRAWRSVAGPPYSRVDASACASATSCTFLTIHGTHHVPQAWTTADLGGTYVERAFPVRTEMRDADCFGATCVAVGLKDRSVGGTIVVSIDAGVTWTTAPIPSAVIDVYHVSCGSAQACTAVGRGLSDDPIVLATTNAGTTWRMSVLPSTRPFTTSDVACSYATCIVSALDPYDRPVILTNRT
jgi:hypothetical protein